MEKPVLIVMAAGMGSRYGGLKQLDPMDDYGHVILDFSVYDAMLAGFEKVIFIIKKENEALFRDRIGDRMSKKIQVEYVHQELENLPEGFHVPKGREKPFGTGHAVLCCKDKVKGPFAVINADDFYGRRAFEMVYDYLAERNKEESYRYVMAGYLLKNTLTENGHVSRGICQVDDSGNLTGIEEQTRIEKHKNVIEYTEDEGLSWHKLPEETVVSMNMWGFGASMMEELESHFPAFLRENLDKNPLKCEFFLPFVVQELIEEKKASVQVLKTKDRWYGITYKEDKAGVMQAVAGFKKQGIYPEQLWES